ncbi:hypothetical protein J8L88_02670 [Aquimarina sp. MMG015]|uniref:hypothetical protein n=1 Tax=Aquimarina sp. MMG015 TaxID=2822689 RepID=UPI001B39D67D|nr:hypothetical protein [Aquimarina sp. MMG015]MBQ4801740.1 hypothetical protein [Aquimarina sp. MMG015]
MKKNKNEQKLTLKKLNVARLNNTHLIKGGSYLVDALDDGSDTTGGDRPAPPPPPPNCITSVIPINHAG